MEKTESALETESVGYLEAFLYRVPKRNHTAIEQNLKKFMQWFKKNGIMLGTTELSNSETMEDMESIAKAFSASEDEDIWIELRYFRDRMHCEVV